MVVDSHNSGRNNHALLEGSFSLIDKTVEEFFAGELELVHGSSYSLVFSEVFERSLQIARDLLSFVQFALLLQIFSVFLVCLQPLFEFVILWLFDQFDESLHLLIVFYCTILLAEFEIDDQLVGKLIVLVMNSCLIKNICDLFSPLFFWNSDFDEPIALTEHIPSEEFIFEELFSVDDRSS